MNKDDLKIDPKNIFFIKKDEYGANLTTVQQGGYKLITQKVIDQSYESEFIPVFHLDTNTNYLNMIVF